MRGYLSKGEKDTWDICPGQNVKQREASLGPIGGDEENDTEDDTEDELEDETGDEVAVGGDEESDGDCDRKKSAVFLHLLSHPKCLQVYDDFSFSVLCRARYASQLKVLEAVCIRLHKPDLCKQKKHVVALRLFSCFSSAFSVIGGFHPQLSAALTSARVSFVGM